MGSPALPEDKTVSTAIAELPACQTESLVTPAQMLAVAVQQGADLAKLEKLMELQERWERNQARKAFESALSAAKAEIRPIVKNRQVDYTSNRGRTNYSYEDFSQVAAAVDPALSRHGLSYRFRSYQEGKTLTVVCILSHRGGHSEETSLLAPNDESGNKNSIQSIGSAATYLQRYTLKLALGLAAGHDDDAQAHGRQPPAPIGENGQAALSMLRIELQVAAKELAQTKGVEPDYVFAKIRDIVQSRYPHAADTSSEWGRPQLLFAIDSIRKTLANMPGSRSAGAGQDPSETPEPTTPTTAATTTGPLPESKLSKPVIDQLFAELRDAGLTWRDLLNASEKVVGRKLGPNGRAIDLTISEGARVIDWCKRTRAERAKAKEEAAA